MTHAANARGMSQPGLSRIVKELENRIRSRLVRRTGRGIELTPAGERFLQFARDTTAAFDQTRQDIAALSSESPAYLRLAVPVGIGPLLAPRLQRQLALELPSISVDVFEERTALSTDAMLLRQYDAVVTYGYGRSPESAGDTLFREHLHLVGARDLMDKSKTPIALRELAGLPLMLPPAGHFRTLIDGHFKQAGVKPRITREFVTAEAILAYVLEGEGLAILPYSNIVGSHDRMRLNARLIVKPQLTRGIRLLSNPTRYASQYQQVMRIVRDSLEHLAASVRWRSPTSRRTLP